MYCIYVFFFQIDLQTFLTLTDQDLKELGITTFGARRKMLLAISGTKKRNHTHTHTHNVPTFLSCRPVLIIILTVITLTLVITIIMMMMRDWIYVALFQLLQVVYLKPIIYSHHIGQPTHLSLQLI